MLVENIIIKRVGELRTGISKSTGNKWANRDILLEWEEEGAHLLGLDAEGRRLHQGKDW